MGALATTLHWILRSTQNPCRIDGKLRVSIGFRRNPQCPEASKSALKVLLHNAATIATANTCARRHAEASQERFFIVLRPLPQHRLFQVHAVKSVSSKCYHSRKETRRSKPKEDIMETTPSQRVVGGGGFLEMQTTIAAAETGSS